MTSSELMKRAGKKIGKLSNWRIRQWIGNFSGEAADELIPMNLQLEEKRYEDCADYLICAYMSAAQLIEYVNKNLPDIRAAAAMKGDE